MTFCDATAGIGVSLGHMEWRIDVQTGVMSWNSCLDVSNENLIYGLGPTSTCLQSNI